MKQGKIIISGGRYPEHHELETANILITLGYDITFLTESRTEGAKNADIEMNGVIWEMKRPMGKSKQTIKKIFERATKQSDSIILDMRSSKLSKAESIAKIEKEWYSRRNIRRLFVIYEGKILDYHR